MKKTVLIIDDDESSRRIADYFSRMNDLQVFEAWDGEQGVLKILNEHHEILILDWMMPHLDGRDTLMLTDDILNQAKTRTNKDKIKIILYTSVNLENLPLPQTKNFKILGYVNKRWSMDFQRKKFNSLLRAEKQKGAA